MKVFLHPKMYSKENSQGNDEGLTNDLFCRIPKMRCVMSVCISGTEMNICMKTKQIQVENKDPLAHTCASEHRLKSHIFHLKLLSIPRKESVISICCLNLWVMSCQCP